MRGKVSGSPQQQRRRRITPAYAGKSSPAAVKVIFGQDHPRLCGEKIQNWLACWQEVGSPPPMRGKVRVDDYRVRFYRITPAYAGKRSSQQSFKDLHQDHPRLCGEKFFRLWFLIPQSGSPPPMRGKAPRSTGTYNTCRITPAYAGKRPLNVATFPECRDHPRLCGEKPDPISSIVSPLGSPPPMRGKGCTET